MQNLEKKEIESKKRSEAIYRERKRQCIEKERIKCVSLNVSFVLSTFCLLRMHLLKNILLYEEHLPNPNFFDTFKATKNFQG